MAMAEGGLKAKRGFIVTVGRDAIENCYTDTYRSFRFHGEMTKDFDGESKELPWELNEELGISYIYSRMRIFLIIDL